MEMKQEYLHYLDQLRHSGETSMFGAGVFLERRYGLSKQEAKEVLTHWMNTFARRFPQAAEERKKRMRQ